MDPYAASQPLTGEYQPMGPDEDEHQNGFFKKVFGIVASQLLFTAFFCAFCMASTEITEFLIENVWIVIVFLVLGVVCMCLPLCSKTFSRRVPHNYINLGIFVMPDTDHVFFSGSGAAVCGVSAGTSDSGRGAHSAGDLGVRHRRDEGH